MTLTQSDDTLELLADVAGSFATPDPERVRAWRDAGGAVDREMWQRIADNGWLSIMVPEELEGAGLGIDAVAIVAMRLGSGCFPEPFAAAGVLAPLVLAAGDDEGALKAAVGGDLLIGVGWQFDVVAETGPDGHSLKGASSHIPVPGADAFVVAARGAAGTGLYWVPDGVDGLSADEQRTADGGSSLSLTLDAVPARELIGPPHGGEALDAALDSARIAVSAELVGIGDRVIELTLDYLRQREQFGRPIGSFQALQHRAVDAWMELQLARAALDASIKVHLDPESSARARAAAASSVKYRASSAIPRICTSALQLHGAIGFTDEYDLGLYLNRALTLAPWLGNAAEHRRRYADLLDAEEAST
jgi:alkylation response protein AidB-like acyl-CoA dehydrogenase